MPWGKGVDDICTAVIGKTVTIVIGECFAEGVDRSLNGSSRRIELEP